MSDRVPIPPARDADLGQLEDQALGRLDQQLAAEALQLEHRRRAVLLEQATRRARAGGQGAVPVGPWLTTKQAAARLHVSERSVENYVARGRLTKHRAGDDGRTVRYHVDEVDAVLRTPNTRGNRL